MRVFLLLTMFIASCVESDSNLSRDNDSADYLKQNASFEWICYHPGSKYHNQKCVEDEYPNGCYVSGNQSKFCWILKREDCEGQVAEFNLEVCKNAGFR